MELSPETKQRIEDVKRNGLSVFSVEIASQVFVYRAINRKEYRDLQKILMQKADAAGDAVAGARDDGEEDLVMLASVSPKFNIKADLLGLPAGVVSKLAELVMQASGFNEPSAPIKL